MLKQIARRKTPVKKKFVAKEAAFDDDSTTRHQLFSHLLSLLSLSP